LLKGEGLGAIVGVEGVGADVPGGVITVGGGVKGIDDLVI